MSILQNQPKVFEGIRVIDFCHGGVGPLFAKFFADAGAQVIKIETHTRTEVSRRAPPFKQGVFHVEGSAQFASNNHNKYSITLNLKHPKGIELTRRLISISDIVADSFTPGVMPRIGLGYEDLKKVKPDIIQISMSFAGATGPYRPFRGHGPILAALVGFPGLVGWEGMPPLAPSLAYSDYYLPQVWVFAAMTALMHRDATGQGQFIDASDMEGAIDILDTAFLDYSVNRHQRKRLGNRHEWAAPYGCYQCKGEDRWCVINVFKDEEWRGLCQTIGLPALATDERFATFAKRKENEDALDQIIGNWTKEREADEVMRVLQAAGVPAGAVKDCADTLRDPQFNHRHHFWDIPGDPNAAWFTYETQGYRLSETPQRIEKTAPLIGEDNYFIFHDVMGLDDEEFAEMVAVGAID